MLPERRRAAAAHGIVLLAAGSSSRLQQPKQLLRHHGESLVRRAARCALSTSPDDAVIVIGNLANAIFSEVADLPMRRVDCVDWQNGMSASLRAGVTALSNGCRGVLVVLCDQPALESAHLQILCNIWYGDIEQGVASFYRDRAGVPALLPRAWFADLDSIGDRGARDLISARLDRVRTVTNEALAVDIDYPEDLQHLA